MKHEAPAYQLIARKMPKRLFLEKVLGAMEEHLRLAGTYLDFAKSGLKKKHFKDAYDYSEIALFRAHAIQTAEKTLRDLGIRWQEAIEFYNKAYFIAQEANEMRENIFEVLCGR